MYILQKQKWLRGDRRLGLLPVSSSKLAEELGARIITPRIPPRSADDCINWGVTNIPTTYSFSRLLNEPEAIKKASNKLITFKILKDKDVNTPAFAEDKEEAKGWINQDKIVFCRTKLYGSKGEGIVVARREEELVDAPLYVLYTRKQWEYRVHVVCSEIIHVQQKRRLTSEELVARGIDEREPLIRNLNNGYIFSTNLSHLPGSTIHEGLCDQATEAVEAIGLDFGAVDLIVKRNGRVEVLEINTAPGLEGTTLLKYKEAFERLL